jgi:hypothetical protein
MLYKKFMKKFKLKFHSIVEIPSNSTKGRSYSAVVQLKQLVDTHKMFNGQIYDVNVRGLLTNSKNSKKNKVHVGINDTLVSISNGSLDSINFYNRNGGGLLICGSINEIQNNEYEIILSERYHGFGNGQQTISISSFVDNKFPISDDVYIQLQIMVGYDEDDSYNSCSSHNTSNKIGNKDTISNDWNDMKDELDKLGYILNNKKDITIAGDNVINLWSQNYYNIINAYFNETPWVTASEAIENFEGNVIDFISPSDMISVFELSKEIDNWFDINYKSYHDNNFYDTGRPGYAKNVLVLAYKRYYNQYKDITNDSSYGFFKLFMDNVWKIAKSGDKKLDSQYYGSKSNCNTIFSNIENELNSMNSHKKDMELKRLKEILEKNSIMV